MITIVFKNINNSSFIFSFRILNIELILPLFPGGFVTAASIFYTLFIVLLILTAEFRNKYFFGYCFAM